MRGSRAMPRQLRRDSMERLSSEPRQCGAGNPAGFDRLAAALL
jgi:hypothetical protein